MLIEMRKITEIQPFANNPRIITEEAVTKVANSLQTFGFRQPIVVDELGIIIVGHVRHLAAQKLGFETVPVHVATGLTPEKIKAYRLADNQTATLTCWDEDKLIAELLEIQKLDCNLDLTGFSPDYLESLLSPGNAEGLTDPDAVPEPPDEPVTRRGDLYILGNHRLLCGDSAKVEDVDRLIGNQPIHLAVNDPPYNVQVSPRSKNAIDSGVSSFSGSQPHQGGKRQAKKGKPTPRKLRAKDRPLANDYISEQEYDRLLDSWFSNIARVLLPGHGFFIWAGYANLGNFPSFLKKHGLYFSQGIVWDKQHPVMTRKDFMGAFEICFYGWREGAAHRFFGPRNCTDLWHVKKIAPQSMIHLTQKPVELALRSLEYSSQPGENVLDLFGGSGSTLMAAECSGRHSFLMEIDEAYCDTIVNRWQQFTGKKATKASA